MGFLESAELEMGARFTKNGSHQLYAYMIGLKTYK
jgi:hypothetical protein